MAGRKNFSWYNGMSVEHLFIAMKDECRCIDVEFSRMYVETGLEKLIKAARTAPEFRNQKEIESVWRLVQPQLRASGVLGAFDTPAIKAKLVAFVKGTSPNRPKPNSPEV